MAKRHHIERTVTVAGYFARGVVFFFVVAAFSSVIYAGPDYTIGEKGNMIIGYTFLVSVVATVFFYFLQKSRIKHRAATISAMATENRWDQAAVTAKNRQNLVSFRSASMTGLSEENVNYERNCLYTPDWAYCDYSYPTYTHGKTGKYKSGEVLYAAMGTKLPRKLPNVLFDSLQSRKRQFRFKFKRSQRHSLEGDFDKYFATYFPENYTIDSMSFISPDVMLALREASDYDFEIQDDNLYMFGSMYEPREQIPEMSAKLMKVKQQLLDNILTYRDERLAFAEGRKTVDNEGLRLKHSIVPTVVGVGFILLMVLFQIIGAIADAN